MRRTEEELETALRHFRNYLRVRGFTLSVDAGLSLREYVMEKKRKESILTTLSKREKTPGDLIEGFSKLATVSSEIALSEGRRNVTTEDVKRAIKRLFCGVWPFCE